MRRQGISIFVLVTFVMLVLTGCKDKSPMLLKTWKVENIKYEDKVPESMKQNVDQWAAQMKELFTITYNGDGTYFTKFGQQTLKGKWKLNWNSSAINAVTDGGDNRQFKIKELSDEKFSFVADESGKGVIFEMVPAK